jgi:ubiquitin thioesterase protein OTUB1
MSEPNKTQEEQQKEREEMLQMYDTQQQQIKEEVENDPLISAIYPLSTLEKEFENADNFLVKIQALDKEFGKKSIRKARKDGSCFYRSFIYRFCEVLCMGEPFFKKFNIFEKIKKASAMLVEAGFEKLVFEDFEVYFVEFLESIRNGSTNLLNLHQALSDKSLYDYYVMYLRFLISGYIRTSGPIFEMYFESDHDLRAFCTREVEPIDAEADQIQMISLFNVLEIPVRIFYVDNSGQPLPTVFSLPDLDNGSKDKVLASQNDYLIQLLYRPGHYDILY